MQRQLIERNRAGNGSSQHADSCEHWSHWASYPTSNLLRNWGCATTKAPKSNASGADHLKLLKDDSPTSAHLVPVSFSVHQSVCLGQFACPFVCSLSTLLKHPPLQCVNPRSIFSERHWQEGREQEGNVEFAGSCLHLTDSVSLESATERESATHLNRWHRLVLRMSEQLHKICMACHKVAQPGKVGGLCGIRVAFCCCLRDRNANHAQCLVSCPYNTV